MRTDDLPGKYQFKANVNHWQESQNQNLERNQYHGNQHSLNSGDASELI